MKIDKFSVLSVLQVVPVSVFGGSSMHGAKFTIMLWVLNRTISLKEPSQ